ncbi:putative transcriptional regulator DJ-1 [Moesziomyces antarcticus T-34]|uniref:Putative transcriptional regulator DJ-1 n=1 Tax=Pseudozyma antarctica (strain T-34) TaxID=1151754 RepID=M9LRZ3_PSEA3|nr:putative transcriptional regulator DJ-1 [Moesziomyces antarcticus T-34]
MLVYMSQYVEERSASPAPIPTRPPVARPPPSKSKKGKINFVSKASLAIFDPRHAMGIDTGRDWYEADYHTPESRSSFDHASHRAGRYSEDRERSHKWTASPTPELEAFATSMEDYAQGPSDVAASLEMTRQPSASSSVFEDDRDAPEMPARRRFYSRKSVAASASNTPTSATFPSDDLLFSPLGTKPKSSRSAGAGANAGPSSSSLARFFTRKKKDKAPHLSGLASRSTPDLFDGVPQSAPPTTLTFEQSGFHFSPQRKGSSGSSLHESPSSLPTSPERAPLRMVQDFSPSRTSPLSTKKSMPALRQIREAQSGAGAANGRSITFAAPEERPRPRHSNANARSDMFDAAPALPPLPSFDSSSPMIPLEFAWDAKRRTGRESQMPMLGANRPVSRVVSSTGRGVPSPALNPIRLNDLRKSTITLRNEPVLQSGDEGRSPTGKSAALGKRSVNSSSAKRLSMTQRRAKAVAVASPLLLSRSPLMAGRSGTPLPVVNIMPPTPDLAATSEDHEHQEEALQRYETVVAQQKPVEATPVPTPTGKAPAASEQRALPSRSDAVTPTPKSVPVATAPVQPAKVARTAPASPESVYSPASVYSPEESQSPFAPLLAGLLGNDEAVSKEQVAITADSVAAELSYAGVPRTESVTSQLSEADSHRSSSSGAFAFSRSMSSSSFASGGTFSSASSNASESPERRMNYLPSSTTFEFSPTKMTSSTSVASTAGTSIFELEAELRGNVASKGTGIDVVESSDVFGSSELKKAFQLKGASAPANAPDSSDCDTPTLASVRQMGASVTPATAARSEDKSVGRQLGLSMDLSELAQELGLGRLSQIGLAHLKGVESLAEKPAATAAAACKKMQPVKPPKSSARGAAGTLSRFGMGMNDIASSAAMSPLPVSIAGRSPQTPPRTRIPLTEPQSGPKVSASGVPKAEGGFGLGLNFVESPSPQSQPRKAAIAPGSYGKTLLDRTQAAPAQIDTQLEMQAHHEVYEQEEPEWVGVAM